MKKWLCSLSVVLLFAACGPNEDGYTALKEGVFRKLVAFDENTVKDGIEYIELGVHGKHKDGKWLNRTFLFRNVSAAYLSCLPLGQDILAANEGDSIAYQLPYDCIYGGLIDPWAEESVYPNASDTIDMCVAIRSLRSFKSYQASLEKQVVAGAMEENAFLADFIAELSDADDYDKLGDIYFKKLNESDAVQIASGMEVEMQFSGHFLNDSSFTHPKGEQIALYFQLGKPDQVIKALEMAALRLNSGESAQVYLPSHMGFGQRGSTTGIVPPKTPTYYKIGVYALDSLGKRI